MAKLKKLLQGNKSIGIIGIKFKFWNILSRYLKSKGGASAPIAPLTSVSV